MKVVIKLILFVALFYSCQTSFEEQVIEDGLDIVMEVKSCISLYPDFTYNYLNGAGYSLTQQGDELRVSCLSGGNLFAFNARSGAMVEKKEMVRQGPGSVGQVSTFDAVLYLDSVNVVYANHSENKIFSIGRDTVRTIADYSSESNIRIGGTSQNPPIVSDNYFIFPAYPGVIENLSEESTFVAVSNDLKEYKRVIKYPDTYRHNFFGSTPYVYWPSIVFNGGRNIYLVSFPMDHILYEYDADFNLQNEYKVFHESVGEIIPYDKPLNEDGMPDWKEDREYFLSTNQFIGLFYLPGPKQYVRIARIPDPQGNAPNSYKIFVYNERLTQFKEFNMSSAHQMSNVFAIDSSIYFLNELRLENERTVELPFDCITFVERNP